MQQHFYTSSYRSGESHQVAYTEWGDPNNPRLLFCAHGQGAWFRWVKAPTSTELTQLTQVIARRVGRFLERQGLLERDEENSYLADDALEAGPMDQLRGHSITYRIAIGPQQGRKVFTLQSIPPIAEPKKSFSRVAKVADFSLHAGVMAEAHQRDKFERLCRYIARPDVSEKRNENCTYYDDFETILIPSEQRRE